MGRPPCCDKVGIKKGPWTPEEDIILVSYIQEHGPGNWRSVPTNTGLLRCSKSCRLRWTNYLRPGIKRGNFTPHEEGMIIHLQALLGNKWAAIASYLPQRTDNDIKNYWNTHLKKKLKKFQSALDPQNIAISDSSATAHQYVSNRTSTITTTATTNSFCTDRINSTCRSLADISSHGSSNNLSLKQSSSSSSSSTIYASSTENISRLLEGWMRSSPKSTNSTTNTTINIGTIPQEESANHDHHHDYQVLDDDNNNNNTSLENNLPNGATIVKSESSQPAAAAAAAAVAVAVAVAGAGDQGGGDLVSHDEFESILSFDNMNNVSSWDRSTCDSTTPDHKGNISGLDVNHDDQDIKLHILTTENINSNDNNNNNNNNISNINKQRSENSAPPLSFLEKWLLDESTSATTGQVEEMMELSPMF